ncbi:unnamed protein product [Prunus armeniaca]|uniref:Uncharacterized protein n=1 Tax=Prunus armeniaca TaxID=36596 RepID=A0A6J5VKJ2_PRUAR|nr:unnamed protein product [Prunus armeniaca]
MSSIVAVLQMLLTTKGTVLTSPKLVKLNYVKGLNYGNSNEPDGDFEDRNAIKAVSEAKRPVTKVEEYNKHPPSEAFKSAASRTVFFVLAIMNL